MNKIFRSIWNQSLGTWVAAPETGRHGGGSPRGAVSTATAGAAGLARRAPFRRVAGLALLAALLPLWLAPAQAQTSTLVWTGVIDNDVKNPDNWVESPAPVPTAMPAPGAGATMVINLGGTTINQQPLFVPAAPEQWESAMQVGAGAGQSGSLTIEIATPSPGQGQAMHWFAANAASDPALSVGLDGGTGTVTLDQLNDVNQNLVMGGIRLGHGGGSSGTLQVLRQGKTWPSDGYLGGTQQPLGLNINAGRVSVGSLGGTGALSLDGGVMLLNDLPTLTSEFGASGGSLVVGYGGQSNGTVNILNGGKLKTRMMSLGGDSYSLLGAQGGQGTLNVIGSEVGDGSWFLAQSGLKVGVGAGSRGEMNLLGRGKTRVDLATQEYAADPLAYNTQALVVGEQGGSGQITVSGAGADLMVGGRTAIMGATVKSIDGVVQQVYTGPMDVNKSTDEITAAPIAGQLVIGGSGTGALTVVDGGTVHIGQSYTGGYQLLDSAAGVMRGSKGAHFSEGGLGNLVIARDAGSSGVVNIGAALGSAPGAPGSIDTAAITFGQGRGSLVFNHDQSDTGAQANSGLQFNTPLIGQGTLAVAGGTTWMQPVLTFAERDAVRAAWANDLMPGAKPLSNIEFLAGSQWSQAATNDPVNDPWGRAIRYQITLPTDNSSFTGPVALLGGTLGLGYNGALGNASGIGVQGTAGLAFADGVNNDKAIQLDAGATLALRSAAGVTGMQSGGISGDGHLAKTDPGRMVLTGSNSYTGTTQIDAGTLQVGDGGTTGTLGSGAVVNNATLVFNRSDSMTVAQPISGSGAVVQQGTGTTILTGDNSYSGGTTIAAGVVQLGDGGGSGSLGSGAVLNNGALVIQRRGLLEIPGAISGSGSLTQAGSGATVLAGSNSYSGPTLVAAGQLAAGAAQTLSSASVHSVAAGAQLQLQGLSQTVAGLNHAGLVAFNTATPMNQTVLQVNGPYVGQGGTLAVATMQTPTGPAADQLLLNGPTALASGSTTVQVISTAGLGAATGPEGIPVVVTRNGASLQGSEFTLAGEHVDAGAFEYRLFQTDQGAALHTTLDATAVTPEPVPGPQPFRLEMPLLAALPEQMRQSDITMLGNLHRRMGDENLQPLNADGEDRRSWGRILRNDPRIRQQGTLSPQSQGHLTGFQAGLDLYSNATNHTGLYVGQLEGSLHTRGFASGIENNAVGFNRLQSRYLGLYSTWQQASGLYVDAVLQGASYRSHLHTADGSSSARTKGSGWLASLEVGQPHALNSHWQIEPQAQLVYRRLRLKDTQLDQAQVNHQADADWTLRLGARIKGQFSTGAGQFQPYGRVSLYKASRTTDLTRVTGPSGVPTDIVTRGGHTALELAAGASLQLSPRVSLYGELGKLMAVGGGSGGSRVKSGLQATAGVKAVW